jgi:DNA-binding response OmpR family regulator
MLTATPSPIDRVVGLELGADELHRKSPRELRELMAAYPLGASPQHAGQAERQP